MTAGSGTTTDPGTTTSSDTTITTSTDTGTQDDVGRAQVIHELNQYLISAYETKIDTILSNLHDTIAPLPHDVQISILRQISDAVRAKLTIMDTNPITPNRREILSTLFRYLDDHVQVSIVQLQDMKQ